MARKNSSISFGSPDFIILAIFCILVAGGLVLLASASSDLGRIRFNDSLFYLKHQMLNGLILGAAGFLAGFFIPYHWYRRAAVPLLLVSVLLLILVFTPLGSTAGRHSSRWLNLGVANVQPAEIMKVTFIIYMAAWTAGSRNERTKTFWGGAVPFSAICGIVGGLLALQPATSTVVILLAAALAVYFVGGAKWAYVFMTLVGGAAVIVALVFLTPYRMARIMTYLNPSQDSQGSSYHVNQSLIAIGSGRITGVGYGQSTSKVNFLPAPIDDSIFAVAAEELGFIGASSIAFLFAFLVFRMMWLARKMADKFGKLLLVGFGVVIAAQAAVHIGANSGLLPLTGVPLPFVSYGGTALAVFLTMAGITVNISKYASS